MVDKLGAQDHLQRDFVIGMITSDQFMGAVIKHWRDDILAVPELQTIAGWCIDYFDKYGKVPGEQIEVIYVAAMSAGRLDNAEAEAVEAVLTHISRRYDGYPADAVAAKFLIDQFVGYDRQRQFEDGLASAEGHAKRGDADQALRDIGQALTRHPLEPDDDPEVAMADAIGQGLMALATKDLAGVRVALWTGATVGSSGDLLPDPWAEPEPPPFELAWLPPVLRHYVEVKARVSGCSIAPIAWACLGACSAALDGTLRAQLKAYDPDFKVPPDLWMLLIGPPSSGKSPALAAGYSPLSHIQAARQQRWLRAMAEWNRQDKETRGSSPAHYPLLYTNSQTIEGLRDTLLWQDRGILIYCEEWGHFLGGMGRYSGGRDAAGMERGFYNQMFDGVFGWTASRADRKRGERNDIVVPHLQGGVAGGTHPDYLKQANRNNALLIDGLFQRCCPILAGERGIGERIEVSPVSIGYLNLIRTLVQVPGHRTLVFADAAEDLRGDIERRIRDDLEKNQTLGVGFTTAAGKLHGYLGRLALTYAHLLSPFEPPTEIALEAVEMAVTLMFKSLVPNMVLTYQMLGGGNDDIETTRAICSFILREQRVRITARDVSRHVNRLHTVKLDEIRAALSPVIAWGILTPEGDNERQAKAWLVNQDFYIQQAHRIGTERARVQMARDLITSSLAGRPTGQKPGDNVVTDPADDVATTQPVVMTPSRARSPAPAQPRARAIDIPDKSANLSMMSIAREDIGNLLPSIKNDRPTGRIDDGHSHRHHRQVPTGEADEIGQVVATSSSPGLPDRPPLTLGDKVRYNVKQQALALLLNQADHERDR